LPDAQWLASEGLARVWQKIWKDFVSCLYWSLNFSASDESAFLGSKAPRHAGASSSAQRSPPKHEGMSAADRLPCAAYLGVARPRSLSTLARIVIAGLQLFRCTSNITCVQVRLCVNLCKRFFCMLRLCNKHVQYVLQICSTSQFPSKHPATSARCDVQ